MITEYVYENQEYENVLVKIKAALMDIISSEENKLYEIEQKITTTTDEIFKEKLSKLCADERCALRQIIITMNTLSASLEKVDSYSKDLDSIEDENIKEIIADLKNENVNNISESLDSPVYKQGETIESINQDPDVVREINDYADSKEEPTEVQEEDIESSQEEPIMVQEQEEIAEPVEQTEEKETPVVEENDEETYPTEEQEETIEQATPTIEEKTEPIEQSEDISNEVEDTPISEQIEPEETITSSEEVVPEVSQEVQNEEQVYENQPIETTVDNTEVVQEEQPEDAPVYDENVEEVADEQPSEQISQEENTPLIPIVTEQTKQQQPRKEKEEQPSSENVEEDVVAPPSVDENGLEQEFSPSIPAIENQENVTYQEDLPKEPLMTFIKVSQDSPKAILTSLKQVTNLRSSYKTQNALLSSRGTIASRNINGVDSEVQELVDNGLLAPSSENIEAMMNEANKLYQEGKINEAQEMYDQISILNKQLQESSSVVK